MRFRAWPLTLRLHRSTYIVAALITIFALLANIPGRLVLRASYESEPYGMHLTHGWPWTFLVRESDEVTFMELKALVCSAPERDRCLLNLPQSIFWKLGSDVMLISGWAIVADTLAGVLIVFICSALYEAWRRRRNRIWQFYLGELLGVITLFAVVMSWFTVEFRKRAEEQQALNGICGFSNDESPQVAAAIVHKESLTGPHWLRHLVGDTPFKPFDRVESISSLTRLEAYPPEHFHPEELFTCNTSAKFLFSQVGSRS